MPDEKEPQFFSFDRNVGSLRTLEEYERLFEKAELSHRAVGEASTDYLRSHCALPVILNYVDHPKIIVCIRHPVDMAVSIHNFSILQGREDIMDFWTAWHAQSERFLGARMPPQCRNPYQLWYGAICSLGYQLQRLYAWVPEEQIHIIQLENMKHDPRYEYTRLLNFLGLPDDGRESFPVSNMGSVRRFNRAWSVLNQAHDMIRNLGIKWPDSGLLRKLDHMARQPINTESTLSSDQRAELVDCFREETRMAEQTTGLDLDHWRR